MRGPLHIPEAELNQLITEAVDEYMQEVRRIKRIRMRTAVHQAHQEAGRQYQRERQRSK